VADPPPLGPVGDPSPPQPVTIVASVAQEAMQAPQNWRREMGVVVSDMSSVTPGRITFYFGNTGATREILGFFRKSAVCRWRGITTSLANGEFCKRERAGGSTTALRTRAAAGSVIGRSRSEHRNQSHTYDRSSVLRTIAGRSSQQCAKPAETGWCLPCHPAASSQCCGCTLRASCAMMPTGGSCPVSLDRGQSSAELPGRLFLSERCSQAIQRLLRGWGAQFGGPATQ